MTLADIGLKLMEVVGGGLGVFLATNLVKLSDKIPWVKQGQVAKVRAVAVLLSAIATVLFGLVDKNLTPTNVQNLLMDLGTCLAIWGGAHVTHTQLSGTKDETPPQA